MGMDEHGPAYPEKTVVVRKGLYVVSDNPFTKARYHGYRHSRVEPVRHVKCAACLIIASAVLGGLITWGLFYALNALS